MLGALPLGTFLDKGCCTRKRTQFAALLDVTAMYDGEAEDEVIVTYEKRCCWASPPNSALAPLLMIGIGAILNVRRILCAGIVRQSVTYFCAYPARLFPSSFLHR